MWTTTPPPPAGLWASVIVFLVLDIIALTFRFIARNRLKQRVQVDDCLAAVGLLLVTGMAILMLYGLGTHSLGYLVPDEPPPEGLQMRSAPWASGWQITTTRKLEYAMYPVATVTLGCIKLSVLFFYRRLFVVDRHYTNARNLLFIGMITIVLLWTLGYCFTWIFDCGTNLWARWAPLTDPVAGSLSIDGLAAGWSFALSDFITDAITLVLPIPFVWSLHLTWAKKLAVLAVFALGTLAVGASAVRLYVQHWIMTVGFDATFDEEKVLTAELYWFFLEASIGLLACCLPTLRSLFTSTSMASLIGSVRGIFSVRSQSASDSDSQLAKHVVVTREKTSSSIRSDNMI